MKDNEIIFPSAMQERLNRVWQEMEQSRLETERDRAKKNPAKHKLTHIMADGKNPTYWMLEKFKLETGETVHYCWMKHRNAAGYFLTFREVWDEKKGVGRRDMWRAFKVKKQAEEAAMRRCDAHAKGLSVV